jgi:hypothetical protein
MVPQGDKRLNRARREHDWAGSKKPPPYKAETGSNQGRTASSRGKVRP